MKRWEMKQLLTERIERITLLELRIDTMEQLVEGYRTHEQAILDTLRTADRTAARMLEEANADATEQLEQAKARADEMLADAGTRADGMLADADSRAEATLSEARRRAEDELIIARAEGEKVRREAEMIKREYEELLASFNAMLEQNASELQETAAKFAAFVKGRRIDTTESGLFYRTVGTTGADELPDPSDDPARLMRNIYRLQNRPLPTNGGGEAEPAAEEPEEEAALLAEPAGTNEAQKFSAEPAAEEPAPFSEAAWTSETQKTPAEPQAEFERMFDEVFLRTEPAAPTTPAAPETSAPPVKRLTRAESQAEVQRAFNSLFTRPDSDRAPAEASSEQADVPEGAVSMPEASAYSETAWASEALASSTEPQAEFTPAFDAAFAPSEYVVPADPSCAFGSAGPEAAKSAPLPETHEKAEESAEAAPFSESAWASEAHASSTEPQEEFTPAFDAAFAPSEYVVPADPSCAVGASGPAAPKSAPLPETPEKAEESAEAAPFSESAWAREAHASSTEPQAEFTPAFDAAFVPSEYVVPADPSCAVGAAGPEAPEKAEESAEAASFSESAWARETHASSTEPQAEGALAFDAMFPRADEAYPRGFESTEEPREWEPEREPEMGDVPTVQSIASPGGDDDVSLDELLEEIIKAGE